MQRDHDSDEPVPDVSICIANWNCCEHLRNCLRSLLRHPQGVSLEVIVVDNASSDGAADMAAREFPEARLIRNAENRGFARANNQAAAAARGEYLWFLNNDTIVPQGALGELAAYLRAHPDIALLSPRLVGVDGRPQTAHRKRPTLQSFLHRTLLLGATGLFRAGYEAYRRETPEPSCPLDVDMVLGAALLTPRRCFAQLQGWDEKFAFGGEDLDICWRARELGRVVYYPHVAITHVGSASTNGNVDYAAPHILAGFARYFRKSGASRGALLSYKLAVTLDAPLQMILKSLGTLWRRCRGQQRAAQKSWRKATGAAAFLRHGLGEFWRA